MGARHPRTRPRRGVGGHEALDACGESHCSTCARLRSAAVELAARGGVAAATMEAVTGRAGIRPTRAAKHYPTMDMCLVAAYERAARRARLACMPALQGRGSWPRRLCAAARAVIAEFEDEPELVLFCVVEVWRSSSPVLRDRSLAARETLVALLAEHHVGGRSDTDTELPELHLELLVCAAHHVVGEELENGGRDPAAMRRRLEDLIELFEPTLL
jgi:AcrR family transcriptional regulator